MDTIHIERKPGSSGRRRMPLRALGVLFFAALSGLVLLAACGGDNEESTPSPQQTGTPAATPSSGQTQTPAATTEPAAGELDPCALLTRAEAEAVVGASLDESERQTVGPFETCIYSDGTLGNYVQVQVSSDVYTGGAFDDAMEAAAEELDIEAKPVSGLGDKAYWLSGILWVQKGDVTLNLVVETPELFELRLQEDTEAEEQQALALATDLAGKALEGLR